MYRSRQAKTMRLRNKRETPVGGFNYHDPVSARFFDTDSNFDSLVDKVRNYHLANGMPTPPNLIELIEDQICTRQPPGRCYYTKQLGDQVTQVIHGVAGAVDKVLGTNLQQKARGCGGCAKRRAKLNQLSR